MLHAPLTKTSLPVPGAPHLLRLLMASALLAVWGISAAYAQSDPAQPELFPTLAVRAGGISLSNTTKIRLDPEGGRGAEVNFERAFGVGSNKNSAWFGIEWLPLEHNQFRFAYYETTYRGNKTLAGQVDFGGVVYPVGAAVSAELKDRIIEGEWTWWVVKHETAGFGLTLGATVLDLSASADGRVQAGSNVLLLHRKASANAPLPSIGIEGRAQIVPRLVALGYVRFLPTIDVGNVKSNILQYQAGLEWMPLDHFGLGADWHSLSTTSAFTEKNFNGGLDLRLSGFQLYARFST